MGLINSFLKRMLSNIFRTSKVSKQFFKQLFGETHQLPYIFPGILEDTEKNEAQLLNLR